MVDTGRKSAKIIYPDELLGFIDDKNRISPSKVAEYVIDKWDIITQEESDKVYWYSNGIYLNNGVVEVKKNVKELLGEYVNTHLSNEILFHLKILTYRNKDVFNQNLNLIHVKNGILDTEKQELLPLSPDYPSVTQIPVDYIPGVDCPNIKKFVREITSSEEDFKIIQEMIGYCLVKDYPFAKSIMLLGGGSNGKTTLINLIKLFLGKDNVSAVALQDLESSRFSVGLLEGRLANLYPDLSSKSMNQISKFKALTGGDMITAEHKFGHPFTFTNYAKMIFSCNVLPKIQEDSDAVWRRWIILNFKNKFEGKDKDPYLLKKITTSEELSGMFNWAMEGLNRLIENGEFSHSSSTEEVREFYVKMSDPVKAFINERIVENLEGFIFKEDVYGEYVGYCKLNGLTAVADNIFSKEIMRVVPGIRSSRPSVGGDRRSAWSGIKLYTSEETEKLVNESDIE